MENNIKENAEKWNEVLEKLEEFMYGDNGIETVAIVDYNLDTYILNTDLVISILTELKKLEKSQNGFTHMQLIRLNTMKNDLLSLKNGNNGISEIYDELSKIYKFIEEY